MESRHLFRGKRIDNGEWVEGYHAIIGGKPVIIEKEPEKYYDADGGENRSGNKIVEIIPDTICQCTGLEDKNGKRIFENDILKDNVIYGVVKWDDANARYIIDDREDGYQDYSEWWHECEIIGNIFDDPELLEV